MTRRNRQSRRQDNRPAPGPAIRADGPLTDILFSQPWAGLSGVYNSVSPDEVRRRVLSELPNAAVSGDWYLEGERNPDQPSRSVASAASQSLDELGFPASLKKSLLLAARDRQGNAFLMICGDGSSVSGFRALSTAECTPQTVIADPLSPRFNDPVSYLVGGSEVPSDRIVKVQTTLKEADVRCAVDFYRDCLGNIAEGVRRSQQAVYKAKGLANTLQAPGGAAAVKARLQIIDQYRGTTNTVAIDGEEDFTITQAGVGGVIASYFETSVSNLCMTTGIPRDVLFGENQSGLNSGEASNRRWSGIVAKFQRDVLAPAIEQVLRFMGSPGRVMFEPLDVETDKDRAERLEKTSASLDRMIATGIIDTEDARRHLVREGLIEVIDSPTD